MIVKAFGQEDRSKEEFKKKNIEIPYNKIVVTKQ